jgi:hypothetical protein
MQLILWFMHIFHPCMSVFQNIEIHSFINIPLFLTIQSCVEAFLVGVFMESSEYFNLKYNFGT